MDTFIGSDSWLLFKLMGFSELELECLQLEPEVWDLMSGYKKLKAFTKSVTIVNDPAERGVHLMSQFRYLQKDEVLCQKALVAVAENRKLLPRDACKSEKAKNLRKITNK